MKPTPGPWTIQLDPARAPRRERMALVVTGEGKMAIDCTNSGNSYAEDCVNARLIAAAPSYHDYAHHLAMLVLQSDLYQSDLDVREQVDNVLAIHRTVENL